MKPYLGLEEFQLVAAKAEAPAQEVWELDVAQVTGTSRMVALEVSYALQCADWHAADMAEEQTDL